MPWCRRTASGPQAENDRRLARRKRVNFHIPPTRASWLNQVENLFSILEAKSLLGASFTAVVRLRAHIGVFIEAHDEDANPFVRTNAKVHRRRDGGRHISAV